MEPLLLHLETSTKTCSVCLSKGNEVLAIKERTEEKYSHAETLTPFIQEVCDEVGIKVAEIDGVVVSEGPGSYTGLRIGAATAKGICFATGAKLISLPSLQVLANGVESVDDLVIPMIDARRKEVYAAVYDTEGKCLKQTDAVILDEEHFEEYKGRKITLTGDGAEKGKELLVEAGHSSENIAIGPLTPSARSMVSLALAKWSNEDFADVAYFEPNYFKAFVAGKPKKLL